MARSRNIKPGLFTNEVIAELPPFDRLLFIGLWCLADRDGRLEDRPKRIKMELFPCDAYDVAEGLASLAQHQFIERYQVGELSIVEILNFQKHQRPHGTEKDSTLPDKNGYLTVNQRKANGVVTGLKTLTHVDSIENNVNQQLSNVNHTPNNALIPDSGFLIPVEDQHNTLNANEELVEAGPEQSPEPVNPLLPCEMTLDWEPDSSALAAYAKVSMVPLDAFNADATGTFVCHYSVSGRFETQAKWVQLLVAWVKRDLVSGASKSNVRPFPVKKQANGPDFYDQTWRSDTSDDL
jgi:hypothetical protein